MAFRLKSQVDSWFKHIFPSDGPLKTKFDLFYLCLVLGVADGHPEEATKSNEFVNNFVSEYQPSQNLIIGMLIMAEISRQGVDIRNKDLVRKILDSLLDPRSPTHLSGKGETKLNEYANRGFDLLKSEITTSPYNVADFLLQYVPLATQKIENSKVWSQYSSS